MNYTCTKIINKKTPLHSFKSIFLLKHVLNKNRCNTVPQEEHVIVCLPEQNLKNQDHPKEAPVGSEYRPGNQVSYLQLQKKNNCLSKLK